MDSFPEGNDPTTFCAPSDALTTDFTGAGMLLIASYWQISPSEKILSPAEISTEHKYLRLKFKVQSPKEPVGFSNEPCKVFLSNIPASRYVPFEKANKPKQVRCQSEEHGRCTGKSQKNTSFRKCMCLCKISLRCAILCRLGWMKSKQSK